MISSTEYAPYYKTYVELVDTSKGIIENLKLIHQEFNDTLKNTPLNKQDFAYANGKWTVKDVIQHIIDTERVFSYRALRFARNNKTELPGFDQDIFAKNYNLKQTLFNDLLDEMATVRLSTIQLFTSFSNTDLLKQGIASGNAMSIRAIGIINCGHQQHHLNILKERYL